MEHAAAIDVPGMEAAGISLEDFVYYHCRVHLLLFSLKLPARLADFVPPLLPFAEMPTHLPTCSISDMTLLQVSLQVD